MHDPNTFSSEIGDVHERGSRRDSFSSEFLGASDSMIESDRRPPAIDSGPGIGRILVPIVLVAIVLGVGAGLVWHFSDEIGGWISSLGDEPADDTAGATETGDEPEPPVPDVAAEPDPAADKVFGIRGAPGEGGDEPSPSPTPEPAVDPTPTPTPTPAPTPTPPTGEASIAVKDTKVRGKVSAGRVESRLQRATTDLTKCWKDAVAKGTAKGPSELGVSFRIKWSGKRGGLTFTGGTPGLQTCVRDAIPVGGWPQPRDGGEASVSRTWTLN